MDRALTSECSSCWCRGRVEDRDAEDCGGDVQCRAVDGSCMTRIEASLTSPFDEK